MIELLPNPKSFLLRWFVRRTKIHHTNVPSAYLGHSLEMCLHLWTYSQEIEWCSWTCKLFKNGCTIDAGAISLVRLGAFSLSMHYCGNSALEGTVPNRN